MNKTAIKKFAIWARNKLMADIKYKAGLLGITDKMIKDPLTQSTRTIHFFDIGTKEPNAISGAEIKQRQKLVEIIQQKAKQSDYQSAYENVIEEVAYTWFNRLIAIRFMEVNDYLPSRIRVLSSEKENKIEPDLVTYPMEAGLDYSAYEKDRILQLKNENKLDELFRMLFIKQCNTLNTILPELFETTSDYTELLLNCSFTDRGGVIHHLVTDIAEDDFNVSEKGQVEIIGWLYQFYNTEPKDKVFSRPKKEKIKKEDIPAATQLFTPDWIVRYMVENSLGRLWVEGHPKENLKSKWKYYLEEPEQEEEVQKQLDKIREEYKTIKPEEIKVMDPCMGSGHILVYAFDVLMQIYESQGYSKRDAAKMIVENNLYGLDIDDRAYQMAYFAVMMKARQYNRRIFNQNSSCNLYAIKESNAVDINHLKFLGEGLSTTERQNAIKELEALLEQFVDAKEYGSLIKVEQYNWDLLRAFVSNSNESGQLSMEAVGLKETQAKLLKLIDIGILLAQKYDVVITNPPYMGSSGMNGTLSDYVKKNYPDSKSDLFAVFIERGNEIVEKYGYNCIVTMQSWMFLESFKKMRNDILKRKTITNLMHMDNLVMGIAFGTVVSNFRNYNIRNFKGVYNHISLKNISKLNKPIEFPVKKNRFANVSSDLFLKIPGSPIIYWISEEAANAFVTRSKLGDFVDARIGMVSGDTKRFLRLWQEVDFTEIEFYAKPQESTKTLRKWFPIQKGGEYRLWYGNLDYVINWENDGYELKYQNFIGNRVRSHNYNGKQQFKEGITWNSVTSGKFSCRYSPEGFTYDVAGPLCEVVNREYLYYILGMLSSKITDYYFSLINPTINFPPGYLKVLPFIIDDENKNTVDILVKQNIKHAKNDWDSFEKSWDFTKHPLAKISNNRLLSEVYNQWENKAKNRFNEVKINEEKINKIFIDIFNLKYELTPSVKERDIMISKADIKRDIISFFSYAVGCMFGRYSLDVEGLAYAGGEWKVENYQTFIPDKDNIIPITDEEYFKDDIVGLFVKFVKQVYGEATLEENLDFIADSLGKKGNSSREIIRNYFIKDFFNDHCKTYSVKGSGKRPIYWLFDSGKQDGFKALIYLHRYDENTIGNLRIDYLHKMQRIYENEIARMRDTIENSGDNREVAAATKRKEKLIKQLQETKAYDEKIAHLALSRIAIDLDDGVKANYEKIQTGTDGKKLAVLAKI